MESKNEFLLVFIIYSKIPKIRGFFLIFTSKKIIIASNRNNFMFFMNQHSSKHKIKPKLGSKNIRVPRSN